ncbi:cohesin domain-containing protein [bacterium]|nr:cohesin domain-containing protein [bacterium]
MRRNNLFFALLLIAVLFISPLSGVLELNAQAGGASLYLSPSTGTYVIGSNFKVSVKVNTGGQVINAAEGTISFDKNLLDVVSVSKGGAIFPYWTTEPGFSNSAATVSFGGGLPPPAYSGTAGHIITITFRAKMSGAARVSFSSGAVLAHDGKGTNILSSMGSGSYTVSPKVTTPEGKPASPKEQPKAESEYNKPEITSLTHPDQNVWYNKNTIKFKWELPDGVTGLSIAFDKEPGTDPGPVSDGSFNEKEYPDAEDGVWYLHLKFKDGRRWGTIAHYRVMIDTNPPEQFEVEVRQIGVGEWPELRFETEDKESGMEKYEIYIGSLEKQAHEKKPDEHIHIVSGLHSGHHTALVKAVDKAGNERIATVEFFIEPIPAPVIINYSAEIKSTDRFYMNGTALESATINIYIEKDSLLIASSSVSADANGNWFYVNESGLPDGRYVSWVEAVNDKGIISHPSVKISFLVSPPVFMVIGNFVIDYFTVFVSLLFMILLVILAILYIAGIIRKRLKKETYEVEEILHKNSLDMKNSINKELLALIRISKAPSVKNEIAKTKERLSQKIDANEKRTLKEVQDVEDILK